MQECFQHLDKGLSPFPRARKCRAKQHGKQDDLQHVAFSKRTHHGLGNDVHEEVDHTTLLSAGRCVGRNRLAIECGGVHIHTHTGLDDIDHDHPDDQSDSREHFKVQQRLCAHPPCFSNVAHAGNANHDGAEDHRGQQHLDELDEGVAQWLHLGSDRRPEVPHGDANTDAKQHLDIQLAVQGCLGFWA